MFGRFWRGSLVDGRAGKDDLEVHILMIYGGDWERVG